MADLSGLTLGALERMLDAGQQILECYRVMEKGGTNVVAEVLKGQGTFYEMDHYPTGDAYDSETHSQYYYHAHRAEEHGHFHTFLREEGMPKGIRPVEQSHGKFMDDRDDRLSHLIGISMDKMGFPTALFTTNRWVTADNWYSAKDVIKMLDRFEMDMAHPSLATNIWITNMVLLFRPHIENLIHERDVQVASWQDEHPGEDAFEDRDFDIISQSEISVQREIGRVVEAKARLDLKED